MNDELRHALAQVLHLLTATQEPAEEPTIEENFEQFQLATEQAEHKKRYSKDQSKPKCNVPWTLLEYRVANTLREAGYTLEEIGTVLGRSTIALGKLNKVAMRNTQIAAAIEDSK